MLRRRYYRALNDGEITLEEFKNKIKQGAVIIDVRSKQEYNEGHLQGSINIPDHEIDKIIEKKIPNKSQLTILYCQSGYRSKNAYFKMKKKGYLNVYNLYGGLDFIS
jgi:phage shock protein E